MSVRSVSRWPALTNELFDYPMFPRLWDINEFMGTDWAVNVPSVNILERDGNFRVELAAPGLDKKDFSISVEEGMLTIMAEKKEEKRDDKENYMRREFSFHSFRRTFRLPENCMTDKIDAKYENGVLVLTLPKKALTPAIPAKEIKVS